MRRMSQGSISSELLLYGGGVRSILSLPLVANNNNIYPMYIEIRVQWTIQQNTFTIINSEYNINNNNIYTIFTQHPYCCVNNIALTLFLNESKFDVRIHSLNLFHSHEAA